MKKKKDSQQPNKKRVFVAMSGGVDSSVAALLLKRKDYNVVGVFMRSYNVDGCAERDAEDARRVASHLKIPFYVWDFEEEYKKKVVEYMVEGYRRGITPNPDVMCNKEIKFGLFLEKALRAGADYVATGHYVRRFSVPQHRMSIGSSGQSHPTLSARQSRQSGTKLVVPPRVVAEQKTSLFGLKTAKDTNKDQSYFLWILTQAQLKHCLFPIGDYIKPQVRTIARRAKLPTAEKKDSQGICFLGKVKLSDFLKDYISEKQGMVLDTKGKKIGEHSGAAFYTIGQRHLGINYTTNNKRLTIQNKKGDRGRFYVASKNVKTNTLVVAEGSENPALYKKEVEIVSVNFINKKPITNNRRVLARVRYRQKLLSARLLRNQKSSVIRYKLKFDHPVNFIAPGQSAVIYSSRKEMLGGGIIK